MFCYIFWQFATFQRNIAVLARRDSVEFCTVLHAVLQFVRERTLARWSF